MEWTSEVPLGNSKRPSSLLSPRGLLPLLLFLGLSLLSPTALWAESPVALAEDLRKQVQYYQRYLSDLDYSRYPVEELVQSAKTGEADERPALIRKLKVLRQALARSAKVSVLKKIRPIAETVSTSPTDESSYAFRRDLILTYDFIERSNGRPPIYPRDLGRPYTRLLERPTQREFEIADGFLKYLGKIPDPPPLDPQLESILGAGPGASSDSDEDDSSSPAIHYPSNSGSAFEAPRRPMPVDTGPTPRSRGYTLIRYYVLSILGALALLYFGYVGYSTGKGGTSALRALLRSLRPKKDPYETLEENQFQEGLSLYRRGKHTQAKRALEKVRPEQGSYNASRYYLTLAELGNQHPEAAVQALQTVALDKLSLDEIYRLAEEFRVMKQKPVAIRLLDQILERDPSYRDAAEKRKSLAPQAAEPPAKPPEDPS